MILKNMIQSETKMNMNVYCSIQQYAFVYTIDTYLKQLKYK